MLMLLSNQKRNLLEWKKITLFRSSQMKRFSIHDNHVLKENDFINCLLNIEVNISIQLHFFVNMPHTCMQLPCVEPCDLSRCPLCQLDKREKAICIHLSMILPIVWGAVPSRNLTTSGCPNLQQLDQQRVETFSPCAVVQSSFSCFVDGQQREALHSVQDQPISKIWTPSYKINNIRNLCSALTSLWSCVSIGTSPSRAAFKTASVFLSRRPSLSLYQRS